MRNHKKNKKKELNHKSLPNVPLQEEFYQLYLTDYFLYKQQTYYSILKSIERFNNEFLKEYSYLHTATEYDEYKYSNMLKFEIKSACFQCVETLFEFIFALEDRDGVIQNDKLWQLLSTSQWKDNYEKIRKVSEGKTEFLNKEIWINEKLDKSVPRMQYLFYFGVPNEYEHEILHSLPYINEILVILAKYFTNRTQYNMIKHAVRMFPLGEKAKGIIKDKNISIDLKDTVTYFIRNGGKYQLNVNSIDTERDIAISNCASALLTNIIIGRKEVFRKIKSEGYHLAQFTQDDVDRISRKYVNDININLTFEPNEVI